MLLLSYHVAAVHIVYDVLGVADCSMYNRLCLTSDDQMLTCIALLFAHVTLRILECNCWFCLLARVSFCLLARISF